MGEVVPEALPCQCSFASDMELGDPLTKKGQALVSIKIIASKSEYSVRQSFYPAGFDVSVGELRIDTYSGKLPAAKGLSPWQLALEPLD
jgi:hypothetical protein